MNLNTIAITAITGLVILVIVGCITYACSNASQRYYNQAHECTARGGSFVPLGNNYSAMCLSSRDVISK